MPDPTQFELKIPTSTILKLVAAAAIIMVVIQLASYFLLLFLGVLVAVALAPIAQMIEKRAPRWLGVFVVALGLLCLLALFFLLVMPSIIDQVSGFAGALPKYREQLLALVPPNSFFHEPFARLIHSEADLSQYKWVERFVAAGGMVANGIFELLLILVIAIYLIIDGPGMFRWSLAFFSPVNRKKINQAGDEVSSIIFAYIAGQVFTSLLVFVFTLMVLLILGVPAAMTLAVLAGVMDILPVLGFFISAIPAVLLGFTVSPNTGFIVLGFFVVYHVVENYFIVPKVYGNRLRLSTLSVLLSLLAAGLIAGIPGAIAVLPIVASYPIIERIWLRPFLSAATVDKHVAQDQEAP
jgi:predicted PurR-regulated permease PerM